MLREYLRCQAVLARGRPSQVRASPSLPLPLCNVEAQIGDLQIHEFAFSLGVAQWSLALEGSKSGIGRPSRANHVELESKHTKWQVEGMAGHSSLTGKCAIAGSHARDAPGETRHRCAAMRQMPFATSLGRKSLATFRSGWIISR